MAKSELITIKINKSMDENTKKQIAEFRDLETIARRKYNLHVGTIKRKFSSERSKLDEELRSEANAIRISTSEIDYMYRCGNTE